MATQTEDNFVKVNNKYRWTVGNLLLQMIAFRAVWKAYIAIRGDDAFFRQLVDATRQN